MICAPCSNNCNLCSTNENNCIFCKSPNLLYTDVCVAACPNGSYQDSASVVNIGTIGICSNCDSTCATCDGSTSSDCLSCNINHYLDGNSCVSSCPSTKYVDASFQCSDCDANCLTCVVQSTNCLTCPDSSHFINRSTTAANGHCEASCGSGYFSEAISSINYCLVCSSSCLTCSGDYCNCTSCSSAYLIDGACEDHCAE